MTVASITAATHTLASTLGQSCDYLSVTNSLAGGGGAWYAGANSTEGTGNTGWIFTAAPVATSFVQGRGLSEAEYAFLARHNQIYSGSINNQRIVFYNSKSGATERHVPQAEIAFLKYKTGLSLNSANDLWRAYLVGLGYTNQSSLTQMKYSFYCGNDTI